MTAPRLGLRPSAGRPAPRRGRAAARAASSERRRAVLGDLEDERVLHRPGPSIVASAPSPARFEHLETAEVDRHRRPRAGSASSVSTSIRARTPALAAAARIAAREAACLEQWRVDPMREPPPPRPGPAARRVRLRRGASFAARRIGVHQLARELEIDRERDQVLLQTVVELALDAAPRRRRAATASRSREARSSSTSLRSRSSDSCDVSTCEGSVRSTSYSGYRKLSVIVRSTSSDPAPRTTEASLPPHSPAGTVTESACLAPVVPAACPSPSLVGSTRKESTMQHQTTQEQGMPRSRSSCWRSPRAPSVERVRRSAKPQAAGDDPTRTSPAWDAIAAQAYTAAGLTAAGRSCDLRVPGIAVYDRSWPSRAGYEPFAVDVDAPDGRLGGGGRRRRGARDSRPLPAGPGGMIVEAAYAGRHSRPSRDGQAKTNGIAVGSAGRRPRHRSAIRRRVPGAGDLHAAEPADPGRLAARPPPTPPIGDLPRRDDAVQHSTRRISSGREARPPSIPRSGRATTTR